MQICMNWAVTEVHLKLCFYNGCHFGPLLVTLLIKQTPMSNYFDKCPKSNKDLAHEKEHSLFTWRLKVHFVIHSLIPPFFSKKVEIFTSEEAFRYIMFVCKIFLANSFVWRNNRPNCLFIMSTWKLPP